LSHYGKGWEQLTDAIIDRLILRQDPLVFLLWGKSAQGKCKLLGQIPHNHAVLTSAHPSPLSAYQGFFGSKPFSKINEFLKGIGQMTIDWAR